MQLPLTDPAGVFLVLSAIILFAPLVAERARVPGIIGLILAGTLVGPEGLGIIERDGAVALLGGVGLLYLMFLAGLDLDLDGFAERPKDAVVFSALTFAIPMVVSTAAALALGFSTLGALLLASAFTSHTLVSYPIVTRLGLTKHPAITATLGATLASTIGALLVLAVVAAFGRGDDGPAFWITFVLGLLVFVVASVWGLPRLTRRFFAGLGQARMVRFTYVLVVVFGASTLAGAVGIEPIVGAFVAGLSLNRFIAPGSVLMERVQFLGASVLIPLFLIATGMLIDPFILVDDPRVVGVGLVLAAGAILGKWLPAVLSAWSLGYGRAEGQVMFGLSVGQAAGALAAVIVGSEIGLLDTPAVNASVLVILITCLVAPAATIRAAPNVMRPERREKKRFESVIVPIANPASARPLVELAARLAASDNGSVVAVTVLAFDAEPDQVEEQRQVTAEAEAIALSMGADARSQVRIDASPTAGVLHTIREDGGTAMVIGWKGFSNARENFFGSVIDAILANSPVPVLVCRPGTEPRPERIVLSVTPGDLSPAGLPGFELAAEVAADLARQAEVPMLIVAEELDPKIQTFVQRVRRLQTVHDERKPPISLRALTQPGDVVVLGTPPTRAGLGQNAQRVAKAIPDRTVVAIVPRLSG